MKTDRDAPKKQCSNCLMSTEFAITGDFLCRIKGAVSPDYVCGRHRVIPGRRQQRSEAFAGAAVIAADASRRKCAGCGFFLRDENAGDSAAGLPADYGKCKIYSVRSYDGAVKNACSKFIGAGEREVI